MPVLNDLIKSVGLDLNSVQGLTNPLKEELTVLRKEEKSETPDSDK